MPYVLYDEAGTPSGLCNVAQYPGHPYCDDTHADVRAFRTQMHERERQREQARRHYLQRLAALKQSANAEVAELATLLENGV